MQDTEDFFRDLFEDEEAFWYIQELIAEARREWEEEH